MAARPRVQSTKASRPPPELPTTEVLLLKYLPFSLYFWGYSRFTPWGRFSRLCASGRFGFHLTPVYTTRA